MDEMLKLFRRPVLGLVVLAALTSMGCMTRNVKEAYVRAKLYTASKAETEPLAAVMTDELAMANKVSGADKVADDEVVLTVEASKANTVRLEEDYKTVVFFKNLGKAVAGWVTTNIPWLAPVIGGLGVVVGLGKKLMTKSKALSAGIRLISKAKAAVKGEGKASTKMLAVFEAAKADGPDFVKGSKELYAEYKTLKAKGQA